MFAGSRGRAAIVPAAVLAVSLGIVGVALANFDILRYANAHNTHYCYWKLSDRLSKADLVIVGSSRMRRGIDPDQLAELLSMKAKRVVNFGMPSRSMARNFVFVSDMVESPHPPEALLVELSYDKLAFPTSDYRDYRYQPHFAGFGAVQVLAEDLGSKKHQSLVLRARDFLDLVMTKIETGVASVFTGKLNETLEYRMESERENICWRPKFDDPVKAMVKKHKKARKKFYSEHDDWFDEGFADLDALFDKTSLERDRYYLKQIVRMAKARGVALYFVLLPSYYTWPPPPEFASEFEARFRVPLIFPDKRKLKEITDGGYIDFGHLAPRGREIFTRFVADELASKQ